MNVFEKLREVQTKLKVGKNKVNSFGNYNYRSCEDILEAVKPILKDVNATITIDDSIVQVGDRYYVRSCAYFRDCEDQNNFIAADAYARETEDRRGMDPAQVTGATSSYARKYALGGLLLLDDAKDPDTDENKKEADAKATKSDKVTKIKKSDKNVDASDLDKYVTDAQIKTLEMLLKKADVTVDKFNSIMKIDFIYELPVEKYDEAVKKLETAISVKEGKGDK